MLYKVGVLHDRNSLPFSISNNKNAHSENSLNEWGEALSTGEMPFLITKNEDRFSGISVDMWKQIARKLGIHYRLMDAGPDIIPAIEQLDKGEFHILIGYFDNSILVPKGVEKTTPYYLTYNSNGFLDDDIGIFMNNLIKLLLFLFIFYIFSALLHLFFQRNRSFKKTFIFTISSILTLKTQDTTSDYYFKVLNSIVTLLLIGFFISRLINSDNGPVDIVKNAEHLSYLKNEERTYEKLVIEKSTWKTAIFLLNKDVNLKRDIDHTILFFRVRKKCDTV